MKINFIIEINNKQIDNKNKLININNMLGYNSKCKTVTIIKDIKPILVTYQKTEVLLLRPRNRRRPTYRHLAPRRPARPSTTTNTQVGHFTSFLATSVPASTRFSKH